MECTATWYAGTDRHCARPLRRPPYACAKDRVCLSTLPTLLPALAVPQHPSRRPCPTCTTPRDHPRRTSMRTSPQLVSLQLHLGSLSPCASPSEPPPPHEERRPTVQFVALHSLSMSRPLTPSPPSVPPCTRPLRRDTHTPPHVPVAHVISTPVRPSNRLPWVSMYHARPISDPHTLSSDIPSHPTHRATAATRPPSRPVALPTRLPPNIARVTAFHPLRHVPL